MANSWVSNNTVISDYWLRRRPASELSCCSDSVPKDCVFCTSSLHHRRRRRPESGHSCRTGRHWRRGPPVATRRQLDRPRKVREWIFQRLRSEHRRRHRRRPLSSSYSSVSRVWFLIDYNIIIVTTLTLCTTPSPPSPQEHLRVCHVRSTIIIQRLRCDVSVAAYGKLAADEGFLFIFFLSRIVHLCRCNRVIGTLSPQRH